MLASTTYHNNAVCTRPFYAVYRLFIFYRSQFFPINRCLLTRNEITLICTQMYCLGCIYRCFVRSCSHVLEIGLMTSFILECSLLFYLHKVSLVDKFWIALTYFFQSYPTTTCQFSIIEVMTLLQLSLQLYAVFGKNRWILCFTMICCVAQLLGTIKTATVFSPISESK